MENNLIVYGWFDFNELFYVGFGDRDHALMKDNRSELTTSCRKIAESFNQFTIKELYSNLSWARAVEIQRQIIICNGRRFNGTGILTNETLGNDYELALPQEMIPAQKSDKRTQTVRTPDAIFDSIQDASRAYEIKPSKVKQLVKSSQYKDWQYLTF